MLLSKTDKKKAIDAGFREDLIDDWNGEPYVDGLKLFTALNGSLKIERFSNQSRLAAKLYRLSQKHNLTSHCLLLLEQAGVDLSPQQKKRAAVRAEKNSRKRK